MRPRFLMFSIILFSFFAINSVYADLTIAVDVSKSLTENTQTTVTVTVTNPPGSSQESSIVTSLSSSTSWFSVVTSCSTISSLSAGASGTSTCIIKPTSTGSDMTLIATSQSQGGTSGSGSTSGINVVSQSSSLTASISSDSSVGTSATFYIGVTATAPSANDVVNARSTISESGQCTVDTSYLPAQQSLGNITKGTSKSSLNWKLTSSSASGTCSVTVNVVSDVGGLASPSKSITVGTPSTGTSSSSTSSSGGGGGGDTTISTPKVSAGDKDAVITISSIAAKTESNFSIGSKELAVTAMKIKVTKAVTNVKITATKLDARPSRLVSDAPGVIQQYFEIAKVNISASDVEKVTVDFKVEKNWVEANKINESTLALHRYNDSNDRWEKLVTSKVSEDSVNSYYQATSSGLSVFAVAGEKKATAPSEQLPAEEKIPEKKPVELIKEVGKVTWKIILIILEVVVVVGILVYFKLKARRKLKTKKSHF